MEVGFQHVLSLNQSLVALVISSQPQLQRPAQPAAKAQAACASCDQSQKQVPRS
jgi:hypothetical protein